MKGQVYRQLHPTKSIHEPAQTSDNLTELLDNRLHYMNRSFVSVTLLQQHNLKIQQIYLDIIKNKKTIHAKELKEYYHLFTNSKAEALMFDHQLHQNQNIDVTQNNREMAYSLKRLYCRLIQKIMIKLSYYLMNKPSLNFVYLHASELMKKCEVMMRRLNNVRDLNSINEIIERIFQENEEFQEYIFHQLIYRGYINSVDEFYRINGIDIEHREVYERNKQSEDEEEQEEPAAPVERKVKFKVKYENNHNGSIVNSCLRKDLRPAMQVKTQAATIHRAGMNEIESKYKDLIINIDKIITDEQFEEISEAKELEEKDEIVEPIIPSRENTQLFSSSSSSMDRNAEELIESQEVQHLRTTETRHLSHKKTINIRRGRSKNDSEILSPELDSRSELHKKEITIQSLNSSSIIPDSMMRVERARKFTSPFFSKSFVNAIKSIQKNNLTDQTNRLSIKRMSEHIFQFQKECEKDTPSISQKSSREKVNLMQALKKSNHKKSIIKLLNIYKNRTLEQYLGQAQKDLFDTDRFAERKKETTFTDKCEKKSEFGDKSEPNDESQFNKDINIDRFTNQKSCSLLKRTILRNKTKASIFKQQSAKKFNHLERLKSQLKENLGESAKTEELLKNFQNLENKIKSTNKTSIFQNCRLSQKLAIPNIYRIAQNRNSSLKTSPERSPLQLTSILTSNGIQSVDILAFKRQRQQASSKLNRTMEITPTQTPTFPHFEVYDRNRRVIIK